MTEGEADRQLRGPRARCSITACWEAISEPPDPV